MKDQNREALHRVRLAIAQALADLVRIEVEETQQPEPDLEAPLESDLEQQLEQGTAQLTGSNLEAAGADGKKPALPCVLAATWPDGSRVTFGPFASEREALRVRVKAKERIGRGGADAVWGVEPPVEGEACDVEAADL